MHALADRVPAFRSRSGRSHRIHHQHQAERASGAGVAWIAEATEYAGGAYVFYWEPGSGVRRFATQAPEYPASRLELLDDSIVWEEPEDVNDVLAVRRSLLGCKGAVAHVAKPWFKTQPKKQHLASAYILLGASKDSALVMQYRAIPKPPYELSSKLAVFELPDLPAECGD
ncbi:MAG: hypothetical protein JJE05_05080 [Actinobacteria bacterium]|nr:hypothetical protein [Actinomycetota bacterium]